MRVRRRAAILSLVAIMTVTGVAASGCTVIHTPPTTWNSPQVDLSAEWYMASRIKANRAFWGRHELTLHGTLSNKARAHSNWMSLGGCPGGQLICHSVLSNGINGVVHTWSLLGENVGVGTHLAGLDAAFMASPGHAANVLDPRWNYVGIGVIVRHGRFYVTVEFMRA